jgi:hypothetical protein
VDFVRVPGIRNLPGCSMEAPKHAPNGPDKTPGGAIENSGITFAYSLVLSVLSPLGRAASF